MGAREGLAWLALWLLAGALVGSVVASLSGPGGALLYFSSYAVEYMLSVDNLLVFAAIFQALGTPRELRPLALYAGIMGAVLMRASFIYGGLLLLEAFWWALPALGLLLTYTGWALWRGEGGRDRAGGILGWLRARLPLAQGSTGSRLLVRQEGRIRATPLLLAILALEATDFIFALDSVPAVLVLTEDLLIAYTSNVMAVVGLRSIYSLVELALLRLPDLNRLLGLVLIFLGLSTIAEGLGLPISVYLLAAATLAALLLGLALALLRSRRGRSLAR